MPKLHKPSKLARTTKMTEDDTQPDHNHPKRRKNLTSDQLLSGHKNPAQNTLNGENIPLDFSENFSFTFRQIIRT